jgi:hypothetical protein
VLEKGPRQLPKSFLVLFFKKEHFSIMRRGGAMPKRIAPYGRPRNFNDVKKTFF